MNAVVLRASRRQFVRDGLALAGLGLLSGCSRLPWEHPGSPSVPLPRLAYLVVTAELGLQNWAFLDGLRELGYIDGQTIRIDYRFAGGAIDRFPELLSELVQLRPDVIMVPGDAAARAAKDATTTIPVVFVMAGDPVAQGIVAGLAHPGGNLTGLLTDPIDANLVSKRLELLREIVPNLARVAVIWDGDVAGPRTAAQAERAGRALGMEVRSLRVATPDEIDDAFEIASNEGLQAVLFPLTPFLLEQRARITNLAAKARLPAVYTARQFVEAGGLMAYATNLPDAHRRAATYVDRILRGARPADLPVEVATTYEFLVNAGAAQALGLVIPQTILQQTTDVIR